MPIQHNKKKNKFNVLCKTVTGVTKMLQCIPVPFDATECHKQQNAIQC